MVPATHVFQTDGLLRPILTRDGGSHAPRHRLLRHIYTGDSGSCASCLPDRWASTLSDCAEHINKKYDVDSLSRYLPRRVKAMVDAKGERLVGLSS